MKKLFFLAVISLLLVGTISAQGWGWTPPAPPESVSVEGTLQLQDGHVVLSTGTAVYYVPGLLRYTGFIDGLREGARITAEGFVYGSFLRVNKLVIGGREYDFAATTPPGWGPMGQRHHREWGPMGGRPHHGWGPMDQRHHRQWGPPMGGYGHRGRGRGWGR